VIVATGVIVTVGSIVAVVEYTEIGNAIRPLVY
jgi:hypothetical protein